MKNIFKFFGIIVLTAAIGFTLITCANGGGGGSGGGGGGGNNNGGSTVSGTPSDLQEFNDISAAELVAKIKIGWNLGNTLDASPDETSWGNPRTTKAMITAIKNAGFNAIRIPVSWHNATNSNYNIRANWMSRVVEIVNYAADNDMYILLNTHHDEDIFKFTNDKKTQSLNAFGKIWGQIAGTFKNYNEKLIFEGLNEPRTKGSSNEWSGGTAEEHANLNDHYKVFVNTVRVSGGNNGKRILMVSTYAASVETPAVNGLVIPNDISENSGVNKFIVSVHSYSPYNFALNKQSSVKTWSKDNSGDTSPITTWVDRVHTKFVSKGIPVIGGEFGALDKSNESARAEWAEYYVSYARSKGIPCFWWDDGGDFKFLNRSAGTFYFPAIRNALMNGVSGALPPVIEPPSGDDD
jgi:endoglucanase